MPIQTAKPLATRGSANNRAGTLRWPSAGSRFLGDMALFDSMSLGMRGLRAF
jgi:hypothetical protein